MQVVYCCDDDFLLTTRIHVLETLCGLHVHPRVYAACVRIQKHARGRRLRKDKREVESAAAMLTLLARRYLALCRRERRREACLTLQAHARGAAFRRTPLGRSIVRLVAEKESCRSLELLVLKMVPLTRGRDVWW